MYAEAGVQEYWIFDPANFVERFSGPGLKNHEIVTGELLSPLLPGFCLDLPKLFAGN